MYLGIKKRKEEEEKEAGAEGDGSRKYKTRSLPMIDSHVNPTHKVGAVINMRPLLNFTLSYAVMLYNIW